MIKKDIRDYYALQEGWQICRNQYLYSNSPQERVRIIDDWRDSLIDIEKESNKALRSSFDTWENTFFKKKIQVEFEQWCNDHAFENADDSIKEAQLQHIISMYNNLRYKKILQIIQDSGIGMGRSRNVKTIQRTGYQDG